MKRVTKNTVKAIIKRDGEITVDLYPNKANIESAWISPYEITVNSIEELENKIANFEYYNCNSELGTYTHFYIKDGE